MSKQRRPTKTVLFVVPGVALHVLGAAVLVWATSGRLLEYGESSHIVPAFLSATALLTAGAVLIRRANSGRERSPRVGGVLLAVGIVGGATTLFGVWVTTWMSTDPQPADEWFGWLLLTSAAIAWGTALLTREPHQTPPAEE